MRTKYPLVSIIIPLHIISDRFFLDLKKFSELSYPNFEILIITDVSIKSIRKPNIKIILTGLPHTGPAEKRDIGLKQSHGEYLAFIDDDAYPHPQWLSNAVSQFRKHSNIVAVGGPGITPHEDPSLSQYGGLVYESIVTSGKAKHRFVSKGQRERFTEDWPAYNLIVKRRILLSVGGCNCTFYGGEDTFLCLKLISFGKILYDPNVIVFHHRRPLFLGHLRQIYNIGMHRGFFFKKFPKTSRKLFYVLPSILALGFIVLLTATLAFPKLSSLFLIAFLFFLGLAMATVRNKTNLYGKFIVSIGIILTHVTYGIAFIHGLFIHDLSH